MTATFEDFFHQATGNAPELGIFRLAWLEALLRSADALGSKIETSTHPLHARSHDLATNRDPLAQPFLAGEATPPLGIHPGPSSTEHGLRKRTSGRGSSSRQTRPAHATRYLETTRGTLSYTELAPLLAEQVQLLEADLSAGTFDARPLDESLLLDLHARIVGGLVPALAGHWRNVEVSVGRLTPPAPPSGLPVHAGLLPRPSSPLARRRRQPRLNGTTLGHLPRNHRNIPLSDPPPDRVRVTNRQAHCFH